MPCYLLRHRRIVVCTTAPVLLRNVRTLPAWRKHQLSNRLATDDPVPGAPPLAPLILPSSLPHLSEPTTTQDYTGHLGPRVISTIRMVWGVLSVALITTPFVFMKYKKSTLSAVYIVGKMFLATTFGGLWVACKTGPYVHSMRYYKKTDEDGIEKDTLVLVTSTMFLNPMKTQIYDLRFLVRQKRLFSQMHLVKSVTIDPTSEPPSSIPTPGTEQVIAQTLDKNNELVGSYVVKWGENGQGTCEMRGIVDDKFAVDEEQLLQDHAWYRALEVDHTDELKWPPKRSSSSASASSSSSSSPVPNPDNTTTPTQTTTARTLSTPLEPIKDYSGSVNSNIKSFKRQSIFMSALLGPIIILGATSDPKLATNEAILQVMQVVGVIGGGNAFLGWCTRPVVEEAKYFRVDVNHEEKEEKEGEGEENGKEKRTPRRSGELLEVTTSTLFWRERKTKIYDTRFLIPTRRPFAKVTLAEEVHFSPFSSSPSPASSSSSSSPLDLPQAGPPGSEETIAETFNKHGDLLGSWIVKWGEDGVGRCRHENKVERYFGFDTGRIVDHAWYRAVVARAKEEQGKSRLLFHFTPRSRLTIVSPAGFMALPFYLLRRTSGSIARGLPTFKFSGAGKPLGFSRLSNGLTTRNTSSSPSNPESPSVPSESSHHPTPTPLLITTTTNNAIQEYTGRLSARVIRNIRTTLGLISLSVLAAPLMAFQNQTVTLLSLTNAGCLLMGATMGGMIAAWKNGPYVHSMKYYPRTEEAPEKLELVTYTMFATPRTTQIFDLRFLVRQKRLFSQMHITESSSVCYSNFVDAFPTPGTEQLVARTLDENGEIVGSWLVIWGENGRTSWVQQGEVMYEFAVDEERLLQESAWYRALKQDTSS